MPHILAYKPHFFIHQPHCAVSHAPIHTLEFQDQQTEIGRKYGFLLSHIHILDARYRLPSTPVENTLLSHFTHISLPANPSRPYLSCLFNMDFLFLLFTLLCAIATLILSALLCAWLDHWCVHRYLRSHEAYPQPQMTAPVTTQAKKRAARRQKKKAARNTALQEAEQKTAKEQSHKRGEKVLTVVVFDPPNILSKVENTLRRIAHERRIQRVAPFWAQDAKITYVYPLCSSRRFSLSLALGGLSLYLPTFLYFLERWHGRRYINRGCCG